MPLDNVGLLMYNSCMEEIIDNTYAVANALGSPLPAPAGSACYVVRYYPDEESNAMVSLGAYSSVRAGEIALINLMCGYAMEHEYDAPWNADLDEDIELTEEISLERMEAWLSDKSTTDILASLFSSEEEYEIRELVIGGEQRLGDISYTIHF